MRSAPPCHAELASSRRSVPPVSCPSKWPTGPGTSSSTVGRGSKVSVADSVKGPGSTRATQAFAFRSRRTRAPAPAPPLTSVTVTTSAGPTSGSSTGVCAQLRPATSRVNRPASGVPDRRAVCSVAQTLRVSPPVCSASWGQSASGRRVPWAYSTQACRPGGGFGGGGRAAAGSPSSPSSDKSKAARTVCGVRMGGSVRDERREVKVPPGPREGTLRPEIDGEVACQSALR